MIRVVKYPHTRNESEVAFYVGRGKNSKLACTLGNPFKGPSREKAIEMYRYYLFLAMLFDEKIQNVLLLIANTACKHDVALVCHCAPLACHGDVIKELIETALEGK